MSHLKQRFFFLRLKFTRTHETQEEGGNTNKGRKWKVKYETRHKKTKRSATCSPPSRQACECCCCYVRCPWVFWRLQIKCIIISSSSVIINNLHQLCTKTTLNIYLTILSGEALFSCLCVRLCLICVCCHSYRKHVSHLQRYTNLTGGRGPPLKVYPSRKL